jgi:hypothetical protein
MSGIYGVRSLARDRVKGTTSAPTRNATTYAVLAEMTRTITTGGGDVMLFFGGNFQLLSGDAFDLAFHRGGTVLTEDEAPIMSPAFFGGSLLGLNPGRLDDLPVSMFGYVTGLAAGSYTFDLRWKATAGTARAVGAKRWFAAIELL